MIPESQLINIFSPRDAMQSNLHDRMIPEMSHHSAAGLERLIDYASP